jgi:hypothetical protein
VTPASEQQAGNQARIEEAERATAPPSRSDTCTGAADQECEQRLRNTAKRKGKLKSVEFQCCRSVRRYSLP